MAELHFEYDSEHKVLAVRVKGPVNDDAFRKLFTRVTRHVEGREIRAALIDLSLITGFDISAAAVRQVSAERSPFADPMPRYIIATEEHVFGMARMFQIVASPGRDSLHVVRSVQDAHDALGLKTPHFERLA